MDGSFTTLFGRSSYGHGDPPAVQKTARPREIGMPLSLLFIPVLLAGAAISIPVTGIIWLVLRWQEKHFARAMCAAGRSMTWTEL